MRFDTRSAAVMRKAARGPAEIALRQARASRLGALQPINRNAGVLFRGGSAGIMPRRLVGGAPVRFDTSGARLGALGATALATTAVSTAAGTAAKVGIASYMGAGSVAGPIGLVVGAIVGIVVTKLLTKNYLNVAAANNAADAAYSVFNQYKGIAGQVAGRAIGLPAMNAIWKGALYSGLFPLNNQQLCYHDGCLKYRGQPEWIEATINGPDNAFTLATAYNAFVSGARAAAASPAAAGTNLVVRSGGFVRGALQGFRGLGAINGVPEAVVLVDNYLIPANTRDNPAWLVPRSALEHQILYDVADAWLATKHPEVPTTPYVLNAPPAAYPVAPPAGTPVVQPPPVVTAPPPQSGGIPYPGSLGPPVPVNTPAFPAPMPPISVLGPAPGAGGSYTFGPGGGPVQVTPGGTPPAPVVTAPPSAASPLPALLLAALAFLPGR